MNQGLPCFSRNSVTSRPRVTAGMRRRHPTWYTLSSASPVHVLGVVGIEALVGSAGEWSRRTTRGCIQRQSNETEQPLTVNGTDSYKAVASTGGICTSHDRGRRLSPLVSSSSSRRRRRRLRPPPPAYSLAPPRPSHRAPHPHAHLPPQ
jgi:hypothetical protein